LCLSQSRAPRENKSYHPAIVVLLDVESEAPTDVYSCANKVVT